MCEWNQRNRPRRRHMRRHKRRAASKRAWALDRRDESAEKTEGKGVAVELRNERRTAPSGRVFYTTCKISRAERARFIVPACRLLRCQKFHQRRFLFRAGDEIERAEIM